ncbi:MAG: hypothetical protein PQJ50_13815 [Spirochaetales bacterium]|nr:hypothetical protein [Spirochaetales bacterium]
MGKQKNRSNWTSFKFSKNMLIDALTRHLLGLAYYRMTDIGEVLDAVSRSRGSDEESWISSWADLANGLQERAMKAEKAGHTESAASTYLRASTYWRASLMYYSNFSDRRIRDYSISSSLCYERYLQLSDYPGEYVEIPYENSFLPGHFYRSPVAAPYRRGASGFRPRRARHAVLFADRLAGRCAARRHLAHRGATRRRRTGRLHANARVPNR